MAYYLAEEREVQINFDPTVGEWTAWTNIFYWKERFLKNGWTLTNAGKVDGEEVDWSFKTNRIDAVKLHDLNKPKRKVSEKQIENLLKYRMQKQETVSDDKSYVEE